jgi:hypothetical protein
VSRSYGSAKTELCGITLHAAFFIAEIVEGHDIRLLFSLASKGQSKPFSVEQVVKLG